jgi:hypothetical protein
MVLAAFGVWGTTLAGADARCQVLKQEPVSVRMALTAFGVWGMTRAGFNQVRRFWFPDRFMYCPTPQSNDEPCKVCCQRKTDQTMVAKEENYPDRKDESKLGGFV